MTESNDSLHLTADEKFYIKTALLELAPQYEQQGEGEHASKCRMLATRVEAYQSTRTQPTAERAAVWRERLMQTNGEPTQFRAVIQEWIHELAATAADPAGALSEALLALSGDHRVTAQQTALQILVSVHHKTTALIQDPNVENPEALFQQLMDFVNLGIERLEKGQPPWDDDPHLLAIAQKAQQAQQQQQTPQAGGMPPSNA